MRDPRVDERTSDAALAGDAEALHQALSDLVRVYQFRDRDRICCHDISVTQCYALETVLRSGASGLGYVAKQLYLDKSTASRVVDALVAKGYAERAPHPDDGRAVRLTPTTAGRRLYARIDEDLLGEAREVLAGFPPEVRTSMNELLQRLHAACASRILGASIELASTHSAAGVTTTSATPSGARSVVSRSLSSRIAPPPRLSRPDVAVADDLNVPFAAGVPEARVLPKPAVGVPLLRHDLAGVALVPERAHLGVVIAGVGDDDVGAGRGGAQPGDQVFDQVLGKKPNQVDKLRPDVAVTARELLDFRVEGGKVTVKTRGGEHKGTFKVGREDKLATLDLVPDEPERKDRPIKALYSLKEDTLTVCVNEAKASERPKEIKSTSTAEGSRMAVVVFSREKKKLGPAVSTYPCPPPAATKSTASPPASARWSPSYVTLLTPLNSASASAPHRSSMPLCTTS